MQYFLSNLVNIHVSNSDPQFFKVCHLRAQNEVKPGDVTWVSVWLKNEKENTSAAAASTLF